MVAPPLFDVMSIILFIVPVKLSTKTEPPAPLNTTLFPAVLSAAPRLVVLPMRNWVPAGKKIKLRRKPSKKGR